MPTPSTVPLLILIVILWRLTRGNLLAIVLFTSIFEAASALNFGHLGLSPPLFALGLCLLAKMLQGHSALRFVKGVNRVPVYILIAFTVYCVWSSLFYPLVFRGVSVLHVAPTPTLEWSLSNFAQLCYLLASVLLYFLTISSSRAALREAIDWYIRGCVVAVCFAVYQLANAIVHIPYPDAILYSNPSHVIYRAYVINGIWRLNSTFTEASEFSTLIVVGIGFLGWRVMTQPLQLMRTCALFMMIATLIMTQSSLGYVCLAFTVVTGSILYISHSVDRKGLSRHRLILAIAGLTVLCGVLALSSTVRTNVSRLVQSTLIDKKNSDSYRDRTETHSGALETFSETYYLGAGWGSVRASGLVYMLLGNVGIIGLGLFCVFCCSLFTPLLRHRARGSLPDDDLFEQCLFAMTIMLVGLTVAGSEPVQPILWILFGVVTAGKTPVLHPTGMVHKRYYPSSKDHVKPVLLH